MRECDIRKVVFTKTTLSLSLFGIINITNRPTRRRPCSFSMCIYISYFYSFRATPTLSSLYIIYIYYIHNKAHTYDTHLKHPIIIACLLSLSLSLFVLCIVVQIGIVQVVRPAVLMYDPCTTIWCSFLFVLAKLRVSYDLIGLG